MIRSDEEAKRVLTGILEEIKYFQADEVISLYRNYHLNNRFHHLMVELEG